MEAHEKFTRPPEIQAELAALPAPTASGYLDSLQRASLEVVIIARRLATDRRLRDQIDSILLSRSTPAIRAAVFRYGKVPRGELEDAEQEAMVLFWGAIQSESFFEVRFNYTLKRLAMRAGRTHVVASRGRSNVSPYVSGPRIPRIQMVEIVP